MSASQPAVSLIVKGARRPGAFDYVHGFSTGGEGELLVILAAELPGVTAIDRLAVDGQPDSRARRRSACGFRIVPSAWGPRFTKKFPLRLITWGGSSGSPRSVGIFRIGIGLAMKLISQISPPQLGQASGNASPTQANSFAQAIHEVS